MAGLTADLTAGDYLSPPHHLGRPVAKPFSHSTFPPHWSFSGGCSGVTRVDVTRGGNWWVSLFFLKNPTIFSSHRLSKWWPFSCCLLTTPIFPRRLSSVLSKFSHKKLILGRVSTLEGVTRGGPLPTTHPPLVTSLGGCHVWGIVECERRSSMQLLRLIKPLVSLGC